MLKLRVEQLQNEEAVSRNRQLELEERFELLKKASSEMEVSYSAELAELQEFSSNLKLNVAAKDERLVKIILFIVLYLLVNIGIIFK